MKTHALLLALLLAVPALAVADDSGKEITDCAARNVPEPDSVRALRLSYHGKEGAERVTVLRTFGRRTDAGLRQLLVRFIKPDDIRGTEFLLLERKDGNDIYFASPDLGPAKHISGRGRSATLFGTDLSYEDFEHMHGFNRPGESKRLPDETLSERAVYVVETRPADPESSAYESVLSYVDKQTCVALRIEFFEAGGRIRKELVANPDWVRKEGPVWMAHMALMRDLRELTTTQLLVDSSDHGVDLTPEMFSIEGLGAKSRN
jgi:hypothetical protein